MTSAARLKFPLSTVHLSLRWKALVAISLVLLLVNASLAFLSYRESANQFAAEQARVRTQQSKQLRALLDDRFEQMSRLANVVPLLAPEKTGQSLGERLQAALDANGIMLDLEWDIHSVHWVRPDGEAVLLWSVNPVSLPAEMNKRLARAPEQTARLLSCTQQDCHQYLAVPLLWQGRASGSLVLGRSIADALLTFQALTGAEVALTTQDGQHCGTTLASYPVITHPDRTRPILVSADCAPANAVRGQGTGEPTVPRLVATAADWFEVFRVPGLGPGIDALVINRVTAQRQAIATATRNSVLIGVVGLLLSVFLLFVIIHNPLIRLRRLASMLPMLADNRFRELHERLPVTTARLRWRDEMDLMVDSVGTLANRMEEMEHARAAAQQELVWLAEHDPLTGLPNRRRFNQALNQYIHEAARYGHSGALLFFDLDQFKDVNDISGHQMGDNLLTQVAQQLDRIDKGHVFLGRLGGDEFAMIIPRANENEGIAMAQRLQQVISNVVVYAQNCRHQVSASIGIVLFPQHGSNPEQLMADADLAMYQAKAKGRGYHHLYSEQDEGWERANARVVWTDRIATALAEERFVLYFQPIMELPSRHIGRVEALVRMLDSDGSVVPPGKFIPVAEETGQIQAIDHWVLANAIALIPQVPGLSISLNLSGNALQDASLVGIIEALLAQHGIEAQRVTFEITESVAIGSLNQASQLMQAIQALGCRFALDDFGSGYASYAYLRKLPVEDVKIDGAFIRNIALSKEDQIFVRAITEMAHGMRKRVIAEFVEDEEIVEILAELGVDFAQGYHIGRPQPASDWLERASKRRAAAY